MFEITKTDYGLHFLLSGRISKRESKSFLDQMKELCHSKWTKGGVFVDMRELLPLEAVPQVNIEAAQHLARKSGMTRSVVILANPTLAFQFERIAKHSGVFETERYLASTSPNWEAKGLAWITDGIEPEGETSFSPEEPAGELPA